VLEKARSSAGTHSRVIAKRCVRGIGKCNKMVSDNGKWQMAGRILHNQQSQSPITTKRRQSQIANRQSSIVNRKSSPLRLLSFLYGSWNWVALSVLQRNTSGDVSLMGHPPGSPRRAASSVALQVGVGIRFFGISRGVFRYLRAPGLARCHLSAALACASGSTKAQRSPRPLDGLPRRRPACAHHRRCGNPDFMCVALRPGRPADRHRRICLPRFVLPAARRF
jgi:hypothetical protein